MLYNSPNDIRLATSCLDVEINSKTSDIKPCTLQRIVFVQENKLWCGNIMKRITQQEEIIKIFLQGIARGLQIWHHILQISLI